MGKVFFIEFLFAFSCKNAEEKINLYNRFKNIKNEITDLTRKGKKKFYEKYFADNKNNLKKIWKGIKDIVNIKAKNFDQPSCILNGDMSVTEPKTIANTFNKYFTTIADNILKNENLMAQNLLKTICPI